MSGSGDFETHAICSFALKEKLNPDQRAVLFKPAELSVTFILRYLT